MLITVHSPLKGFTGKVAGVQFVSGTAEIDNDSDFGRAAYAFFDRHNYRMVRPEREAAPKGDSPEFDPAEHGVDDVLTHIEGASYEEAVRVLDAEDAGKNRVTITGKRDALLADKTPAEGDTQKGDQL